MELLPSINYRQIEVDNILNFEPYLCRTTSNRELLMNANGIYSDKIICSNPKEVAELLDYSTNLLGVFKNEHCYIQLCGENRKEFYTYWNFEEKVKCPMFGIDYQIDSNKGIFYLKISEIHRQIKTPYNINSKPIHHGEAIVVIKHTPTRSNFWHFSIAWEDENGDTIKQNDAKWKNVLTSCLRALLHQKILLQNESTFVIAKSFYSKNNN